MIGYRNLLISLFCSMAVSAAGQPRLVKSLVPDMSSQAPDYFCTWNLQGYVASYKSTELTRAAMTIIYLGTGFIRIGWIVILQSEKIFTL
mgnify:CR=1 FL=1